MTAPGGVIAERFSEPFASCNRLTIEYLPAMLRVSNEPAADVAQLAEQLICNQQVASSILAVALWLGGGSVGGGRCVSGWGTAER